MAPSKFNLALFFLILFSLITTVIARDILKAHNEVHAEVHLPPLRWSKKLARYARAYARHRMSDCQTVHSGAVFGDNLFWDHPGGLYLIDAVYRWAEEKQFYDCTGLCGLERSVLVVQKRHASMGMISWCATIRWQVIPKGKDDIKTGDRNYARVKLLIWYRDRVAGGLRL